MKILLFLIVQCLFMQPAYTQLSDSLYFPGKEKLEYLIHYGWINGGIAVLQVRPDTYQGEEVLYASGSAKTIGITDRIYNVYDVYESYFDKNTGLPYKSVRDIKEGRYTSYNEVIFDHENEELLSLKSGLHNYPDTLNAKLYDIMSAFYLLRNHNIKELEIGDMITIHTYFDDEFWPLQIRFTGKKYLKSKLGRIHTLVFNPVVEPGRVFETKDDLRLFISDDKNFIPVRVQMDMVIGSFKADLIDFSGLRYPLNFDDD